MRALSKRGRCAPFDQQADGFGGGRRCRRCGIKRLVDALRDGDHIYALLPELACLMMSPGNLMSPDSEGQLRAMRAAYRQAGWSPNDVDLIECHGTGTPVGDAEEFKSLRLLWSSGPNRQDCVIGSVKSILDIY